MLRVSERTDITDAPTSRQIHPVDTHVGQRLRERRKQMGVTQEKLSHALGLTFQQVQKYERGTNRVSASMLYAAARFLKTTPAWFYEGLAMGDGTDVEEEVAAFRTGPIMALATVPGGFELARDFQALPEASRSTVSALVKSLAATQGTAQ